jgi:serine/threonine protein kinase
LNKLDIFWKLQCKNKSSDFYSDSFKELINGLFAYDPDSRLLLAEIKESEWYNYPLPSSEDMKIEFEERKDNLFIKITIY